MSASSLPRVLYVLNVQPAAKFGSMEEQIVFLHRAFAAQGSRFIPLYTYPPQSDLTNGWLGGGIEAHCLDLAHFRFGTFMRVWRLLVRERIDVVHWNMTEPLKNAYVWWLTLLFPRLKHIYTDHNSRDLEPYAAPTGWKKFAKRLLLKRYRRVWCVSRFVQDSLAGQGTWSHLRCCPHFINTARFRPDPAVRASLRQQHEIDDRLLVTTIAQLIPEKGVELIVRALTLLPEKVVLWIVGTGPQEEALKSLARQLGMDKRIRFWGLNRNVEPFLQASDCFVLPSLWQEAAGLVILEAQAAGLPVVASRIGGIPEYVDENRTAFLFPPGDIGEMAKHLHVLFTDAKLRECMSTAATAFIREQFSPESRLSEWLSLYREV